MIQIPDRLYQEVTTFPLPESGRYATGIAFIAEEFTQYKELEAKVMAVIHRRFNVVLDSFEEEIINRYDKQALDFEMPILFNTPQKKQFNDLEYYTPDQAFSIYLNTLLRLEKENV